MIGWTERDMSPPTEAAWGWGIQSLIKDFPNNVLKTLTIGRTAAMTIVGVTFSDNTVLYRGTLDSPVGNSFNIRILDAPRGLDAAHFHELASKDHPPGGRAIVENTLDGKLTAKIMELTAKIEELSRPRQDDQGREKWNRHDVGPPLRNEALVGGVAPLDKQGMAPSQGELGTGATRALIQTLPVQPLSGAWQ